MGEDIDEADLAIASTLQLVWFASLVAWSGELQGREAVIDQMRKAAALMLPDSRSGH